MEGESVGGLRGRGRGGGRPLGGGYGGWPQRRRHFWWLAGNECLAGTASSFLGLSVTVRMERVREKNHM